MPLLFSPLSFHGTASGDDQVLKINEKYNTDTNTREKPEGFWNV
jgi:hypothetical protein